LPSSETRDHSVVTWGGSPNLEPGLNSKDILFFEDLEDDHYQQRWRTHWGKAVGAGTVESPSQYVFAGNRSAYLENKKGKHDAVGAGQYVPEIPIDDVVPLGREVGCHGLCLWGSTTIIPINGGEGEVAF